MSEYLFDAAMIALGALVTTLAVKGASASAIPAAEVRLFHRINDLPDWLFYVLWLPMQLGNLVVGALWGLATAWAVGSWDIAIATAVAVPLKLVVEKFVRHQFAALRERRQRPATSIPGARRRGSDVPESGPSFPSGHVIMVTTIGLVIAEGTWPTWSWAPSLAIAAVMLGRVYVGAHNPLDVVCGLGIGMVAGGLLGVIA
jgi:undecaprenyl-diphosphatase